MIFKRVIMNKKVIHERGDTLIEIMLALSVLGIVVVGCMSTANRLNATMLDNIDRTAVRSDINSQTELLNYVRDHSSQSAVWNGIKTKTATDASTIGASCTKNDNSFYLDIKDGSVAVTYGTNFSGKNESGRAKPGSGIWVDAVYVAGSSSPSYIDFYIKACWARFGSGPSAQSTNVVR